MYWVGHSLGSVIAYDALNRLLRDDAAASVALEVKKRTKLLLTFGSPLGIAEWLKNARRAYQTDRANVDEKCRVAVILLKDEDTSGPARIGLLDVGGANLDDVNAWSVWQDPTASSRGSPMPEEETHGNGGKAYMYRLSMAWHG